MFEYPIFRFAVVQGISILVISCKLFFSHSSPKEQKARKYSVIQAKRLITQLEKEIVWNGDRVDDSPEHASWNERIIKVIAGLEEKYNIHIMR